MKQLTLKKKIATLEKALEVANSKEIKVEFSNFELNQIITAAEEYIPWYNKRKYQQQVERIYDKYYEQRRELNDQYLKAALEPYQDVENDSVKVKLSPNVNKTYMPTYSTKGAAGADLYASESVTLQPNERKLIKTGVSIELPEGHLCYVMGRSGNTIKKGLHVALGLVDEDYRGEIGVMAFNQSDEVISFAKGDRVAQMVILPYPKVEFVEVGELSDTERGTGGYGSTGK
jgi:dUTP pyrophosphatase